MNLKLLEKRLPFCNIIIGLLSYETCFKNKFMFYALSKSITVGNGRTAFVLPAQMLPLPRKYPTDFESTRIMITHCNTRTWTEADYFAVRQNQSMNINFLNVRPSYEKYLPTYNYHFRYF
jgi:hypothetical protein